MGIIFSRFRKKKSTLEVLEKLEKEIRSIEEFHRSTEQQHRKVMGHLMLYAVGLYVLVAFFFYFFFFPATLHQQLLYLLPLLIMPVLFVFVRRVVTWYFRRKLTRNEVKLKDMKDEKKQLLEEVMDKETYKVAKQILEKYAPDQLRKGTPNPPVMPVPRANMEKALALAGKPGMVPLPRAPYVPAGSELRRRPVGNTTGSPPTGSQGPFIPVNRGPSGAPVMPVVTHAPVPVPLPLPRPILPHDRTVMDRLVEYLVGDGPSNRYALICQKCASHNGMALKEEFEYFAFRCCYCYHYNPARKQRPHAPRLEAPSPPSTSSSEAESPVTTSEEEDSAPKSEAPVEAVPSEATSPRKEPVESGNVDEGEKTSQKPRGRGGIPPEDVPQPATFESSCDDDDEDNEETTVELISPTLITSPPVDGIHSPPAATSTPVTEDAKPL